MKQQGDCDSTTESQFPCYFIYASNEPKSVLARDLGDCRDNLRNSRSVFLIVHDNRMLAERAFYCFTDFSGTITKAVGSGQRQHPDE